MFKMKIQKLILGVALLVIILVMVIGNKCNLTGTVQDHSGKGIVFSTLEVYKVGKEKKPVEEIFTDFNGDFEVKGLRPGSYKLIIKSPGFEEKTEVVRMTGKDKKLKTIHLKGDVVLLNPVIIYGKA